MQIEVVPYLTFIAEAEKLKTILRHSWTSDKNRQESVADHSWMLLLMAIVLLEDEEFKKLNKPKILKMLIIHDLAETITGDIPAFEKSERRDNKYQEELVALKKLLQPLPKTQQAELLSVWQEMEAKETPEAKFSQCLDKSEVLIQHILADISTWDDGDFSLAYWNKDVYFDYSPKMREFKDTINAQFWQKMERDNTLNRLKPEHLRRRK